MSGDTIARSWMLHSPPGNCMSGCLFSLAWVRSVGTEVDMDAGVGGATTVKNQRHGFICNNINGRDVQSCLTGDLNIMNYKRNEIQFI